ncbi:hypothetical protein TNCV_563581 [Trichonephila clavipes]|nr:hypothetical protein TNCV_563581 [Trichonephila clavipes]
MKKRELLATDLVILNHGYMTRTISESKHPHHTNAASPTPFAPKFGPKLYGPNLHGPKFLHSSGCSTDSGTPSFKGRWCSSFLALKVQLLSQLPSSVFEEVKKTDPECHTED